MVLERILKQLQEYRKQNKANPKFIYIKKMNYKKLKKEMSILEKFSEDIKFIYTVNFKIIEEEKK